jgi:hypothetical protein
MDRTATTSEGRRTVEIDWRKSTRSMANQQCVKVGVSWVRS